MNTKTILKHLLVTSIVGTVRVTKHITKGIIEVSRDVKTELKSQK